MTSTIIFKTDSKLKSQAQKTADELGLTLTAVMAESLKKFVQSKSVSFGLQNKQKFTDPYGVFAGGYVSEKKIDGVADSWMKTINELT